MLVVVTLQITVVVTLQYIDSSNITVTVEAT